MFVGSSARPRPGPSGGHRPREAGFTLVELLLSLLIFLFLLLIGADLLLESGRLLQHSARRAQDARPEFLAETLRTDLRAASSVGGGLDPWVREEPLFLSGSGTTIVWSVDANRRLVRSVGGGSGRPYLDRVDRWRWRRLGSQLVEVEVEVSLRGGEAYLKPATNVRGLSAPTTRRVRMVVALRGGGGYGW